MSDLVNRVLGDYRLEFPLGAGALGQTFRARHLPTGYPAAVKVLHAHLTTGPGFEARFEREAARAASLRHPNIVALEHAGVQDGYHYFATAYYRDGSLRGLIERRDELLPLARRVSLVRDAALAVAGAHARAVLHRDVKPENVLLAREADTLVARVTDFGLTQLTETGVTLGGEVAVGSPAYLSPEHCRGDTLDPRSDVYSLGVVLYEVATGHPPFQVRTLSDAVAKHLTVPPPRPSTVASVPPGLDAIILRCLAKKPEERYQAAADLVRALDEALAELGGRDERIKVVLAGDSADDARRLARARPETTRPVPKPAPAPSPAQGGRDRRRIAVRFDDASAAQTEPAAETAVRERVRVMVDVPEEDRQRPADKRRQSDAAPVALGNRISVVLDRPALDLTPGTPAFVQATVANGGTTVDHFEIYVDGVPGEWLTGPRQSLQLNPGDRRAVMLTVLVPAGPASHAGTYPVVVRARSRDVPADSGAADARWTVLPFMRAAMNVAPAKARAWRRARFVVTVSNQGNAPAHFALSGADEERRVRYEFETRDVPLEPGVERAVRLAALAPLRWIGANEMRALTVRAEPVPVDPAPAGQVAAVRGPTPAPQTATAQLVHRALIPVWLPPLVLVALTALVFYLRMRDDETRLQIAIVPTHLPLAAGGTGRLTANVTTKAGDAVAGQTVEWSSQDAAVATVSESGVVRGRHEGLTGITARHGAQRATAEVQVTRATVNTLVMSPRGLALTVPAAAQLRAVPRAVDGSVMDAGVTWTSSDPSVATVGGNGRVVAKGAGSATITATAESKVATAEVAVKGQPVVAAPGANGAGSGAADCVAYDPAAMRVVEQKGTGWVVTDGSTALLALDNESDARRALALVRHHTGHCVLGRASTRPNKSDYVVEYWQGATGVPTVIDAEDCVRYNKATLRIADLGPLGWVLADDRMRVLAADTRDDAKRAWDVAQAHVAVCYIGRGNRRPNQRDYVVQYWR